ncbi:hypothetical protein BHE74_00012775 [Ensete ventricosum]|nr:hypothetical protein GW17_00046183 [Ensete ventricosum]RWW78962.1 hypothetical protein BHE74_00012775 [Ensete ventricosum]RZS14992.1 hypothetical protein BHM03_00046763 [Ensete ventricosum]
MNLVIYFFYCYFFSLSSFISISLRSYCCRSLTDKKDQSRVPKKMHKAEREKLKRDQLNELFLELGHVLGK